DRVLEYDFLRWLLLKGREHPHFVKMAKSHLKVDDLRVEHCSQIYQVYLENDENQKACDLISLAIDLKNPEGQRSLSEIMQKKVNLEKAEDQYQETIQRILDRNWMENREKIKIKIQSGNCSDEEVLELVKQFDELKRNPPKI